jgi:hypothetical protein
MTIKRRGWRNELVIWTKELLDLILSFSATVVAWLANLVFLAGAIGYINQHMDEWMLQLGMIGPQGFSNKGQTYDHVEPWVMAVLGFLVSWGAIAFRAWVNEKLRRYPPPSHSETEDEE